MPNQWIRFLTTFLSKQICPWLNQFAGFRKKPRDKTEGRVFEINAQHTLDIMKYKLTKVTKIVFGVTLHQIQSLQDFWHIKSGDLGGWVESEKNLSQFCNAWVSGNAMVFGNARVYGNARVFGDAWVSDDATVSGEAWVYGNARVFGKARVYGNARVFGNAWVFGKARVYGNARVSGDAMVSGN